MQRKLNAKKNRALKKLIQIFFLKEEKFKIPKKYQKI